MKVSLANLLKTCAEKMPDSVSEPKLMKTSEFYGARADVHHNKGTYPLPGVEGRAASCAVQKSMGGAISAG